MFAYSYQTIDDQKGATRTAWSSAASRCALLVTVKNIGHGRAMHTEAVLRNGHGPGGHPDQRGPVRGQGPRPPARPKTFSFVYEVRPDYKGDDYQLELSVGDTTLGESVTDKIKVKVAPTGPAPEAATGTATIVRDDVPLREAAADGALVVGHAAKGTGLQGDRQAGDLHARRLDATRSAFVAQRRPEGGRHGRTARFKPDWQVTPPVLTVTAPTVVDRRHGAHQGARHRRAPVRDVYIRVWNRNAKIPVKKAFYQPNRLTGDRTKMDFEADVPLWPGSNLVQVFARESNEVQSLQTVVVLQRPPGASLVAQPSDPAPASKAPAKK